jgi:2,5-diamino-6-(ribosylamino)-4(3H)-pyrimidinone 5'-phosphate reductase
MLPRVILHNETSVDGRLDRLEPNMGRFYGIAARLRADAILAGSETILAAFPQDDVPRSDEDDVDAHSDRRPSRFAQPLLAVVDSRGRIRDWRAIRSEPWWREVVALCSAQTPAAALARLDAHGVDRLVLGHDRVDLRAALETLARRYEVRRVRVESGGVLNGALLRQGLVAEVSLLVEARLIGGQSGSSIFRAADTVSSAEVIELKLFHIEKIEPDTVWLRYQVIGAPAGPANAVVDPAG